MLLFWIGIFFLSVSGIFLYPVYAEENRGLWPIILGMGISLNIAGCYKAHGFRRFLYRQTRPAPHRLRGLSIPSLNRQSSIPHRRLTIFFLIPIIVGIFSFHFPYNLPLYVTGSAIILIYALRWKTLRPFCIGVLVSGLILSFQTACVIPYYKFAARFHEINLFSPFFYWILKGLGVSCAYSQDTIFVQTTQANMALVTSWEKLGLFVFIIYVVGILVFFYFMSVYLFQTSIWKKIGTFFSVVVAFVIARYIFLCVIFLETSKAEIFWAPIIVAGSVLPLPFILWRFVRLDNEHQHITGKDTCDTHQTNTSLSMSPGVSRQPTIVHKHTPSASQPPPTREDAIINPRSPIPNPQLSMGIAMFFFSFSLVCCLWFQESGILKKGRILIDEYYSDWERTDKEFDIRWYGVQSVYNYYCLAYYLNHFYSVDRLKEGITDNKIDDYDVLIIKTPTSHFTDKEIDTIERYVKNGGGLFLIGDHTNVFGTTTNLNPLAERFGFRFNYDATYDLVSSDLHFHKKNRLYRHPSIKDMPYLLFATSCSMYAPFFAEDIMIASNLKTIYLDYSRGGYFPDKNKELNYTFGLFLQSSGLKYGKGRVLAFADSTCFSNFYMHIPGKPDYALGTINWLNRTNRYGFMVKVVSSVVMALSIAFTAYLFFNSRKNAQKQLMVKSFVRVLLFAGLLGISSSTIFCNIFSSKSYSLPKEHTPMTKIGFEEKFCNFHIPSVQLLHNPSIDFQTFYVWSQRLGYIPALFSLNDPLNDFDIIVMVNPQQYFSEKETKKLEEYITNGGRLLLIDHSRGLRSTANQIIKQYGLKVNYNQYQEKVAIYEGTIQIGTLKSISPIEGGQALLFAQNKYPLISIVKHGNGIIAVMACSSSFTNEEMGETEAIPNDHQQFLYKLEFWILSSMIRGDFGLFTDFTFEKK